MSSYIRLKIKRVVGSDVDVDDVVVNEFYFVNKKESKRKGRREKQKHKKLKGDYEVSRETNQTFVQHTKYVSPSFVQIAYLFGAELALCRWEI